MFDKIDDIILDIRKELYEIEDKTKKIHSLITKLVNKKNKYILISNKYCKKD